MIESSIIVLQAVAKQLRDAMDKPLPERKKAPPIYIYIYNKYIYIYIYIYACALLLVLLGLLLL